MFIPQAYHRALLTSLSKIFNRKLTGNLVHKIIFLIQNVKEAPLFYDFFYFEKAGPLCANIDIDLMDAESAGGIRYYDKQNNIVHSPGICDEHLTIGPGPEYRKIYKENKEFFQKIYPFIEIVKNLGTTEYDYNMLASITYIDNHIEEFIEEKVDKVDFTEMILQEYGSYSLKDIIRFREVLKSYNLISGGEGELNATNRKI